MIKNACVNAIIHLVSKDAEVEVKMTANVSSNRKDGKCHAAERQKYHHGSFR